MAEWAVRRREGTAADLHALEIPEPAAREIWLMEPTDAALVVGSTQPIDTIDLDATARAGFDVVRRRSGGGAVLLTPGEFLWVDLLLPCGDTLWVDDVGQSTHWLGEVWTAALTQLGHDASVQVGPFDPGLWGRVMCFAGRGPGEVTIGGRKVVGISQRRTRAGARFQCVVHRDGSPDRLSRLVRPPAGAGAPPALDAPPLDLVVLRTTVLAALDTGPDLHER